MARQHGLKVSEQRSAENGFYTSVVTVKVSTDQMSRSLSGTVMKGQPHIVRIDDYSTDVELSVPYMLVISHLDRPGMIGAVGTLLGLDDPVEEGLLTKIRQVPDIYSATVVNC